MKLSALALAFGLTLAAANPIVCIACINAGACDSMADKYNEPEGCDVSFPFRFIPPIFIATSAHILYSAFYIAAQHGVNKRTITSAVPSSANGRPHQGEQALHQVPTYLRGPLTLTSLATQPMADPTMDNPCYIKCQSHLETSTDCYCTYAQKEDLDEKSAAGEETSWVPED